MQDTPLKRCTKCGEEKPATSEYFGREDRGLYGLKGRCRPCESAARKAARDIAPANPLPGPGATKICRICNETQPATLDFFQRAKFGRDGLSNRCRACDKAAYIAAHPPKAPDCAEGMRRCTQCKEAKPATLEFFGRAKSERLTSRCRSCMRVISQEIYRSLDGPRESAPIGGLRECSACKTTLPATTEFFAATKNGKWGLASRCRDCGIVGQKLAHIRAPEKRRAYNENRRARKKGAKGAHTAQQVRELLRAQDSRCAYCHETFIANEDGVPIYHIEHIVPLFRGGTNDISNISLACPLCNLSKGTKLLSEWSGPPAKRRRTTREFSSGQPSKRNADTSCRDRSP